MSQMDRDEDVLSYLRGYFERYERYEGQECLAHSATHWLLSTDDFKVPTDPPGGVVTHMSPVTGYQCHILIPEDKDLPPLDLREIHQIIRELTVGIYTLNQLPGIALEANFDQSTTCQLPPAYLDTRVGQMLINVDYMMKALWHGAYFPKEKRTKFSERWRSNMDVNSHGKPETKKPLLTEFTSAGMLDVSVDPDFNGIYDSIPVEQPGDSEMAEERRFFMSHVDELSMQMTLFQHSVMQHESMFVVDADWSVSSTVLLTEDKIDHAGYERLNARLQLHEILLQENLLCKFEIRRQIQLLHLVAFFTPFLIAMKKRMRIPDLMKMLPIMTGDDIRTEREFPPLILGPDFKCKNFSYSANHYFHLHGGIHIAHETPVPVAPPGEVSEMYEEIKQETSHQLAKWLDPMTTKQETYAIPVVELGGKRYHAFCVDFETYYPQSPQKPRWVHTLTEEVYRLRPKRLPLPDMQIHEMFKKLFGYKRAIKNKSLPNGLRAAASRGLVAMFQTLCRKCPISRLGKQDEHGLSLVHYAAMFNRPNIIAILILQSMDVNVRRNNIMLATGPTPLHLASRCGALEAAACLLANYANISAVDGEGWAPVHHAAYFNHEPIIKLFVSKNEALLELLTKNELKSSPLLLAASSGALQAVQCLINLGAFVLRRDEEGNNVIHLAALRFHTNVLEFFIQWNNPEVSVWDILVGMLKHEDVKKKDSAVKCLEVMSTSDSHHWKSILNAGGVPALVSLLKVENEDIQSVAASVLCNISEHDPIRKALTQANAGEILIQLLGSPVDEIQSRASIVLSDLACVDDNQSAIAEKGGIMPLVNLLDSELEDVLVNAVNAIRVMCMGNRGNQTAVVASGAIESLVEFLTVNSDILRAASAAAIAALTSNHHDNQNQVVADGAVEPLVHLIKGRNIQVQAKAACALEALALDNPECQLAFLALDAPQALMKLFIKVWSMEVKEQAAVALWSLAGQIKPQQKDIATKVGISQLIDMLLLASEKLQYVGCMGMTALGREDMENQNKIASQEGLKPLVRLLRSHKTSARVLLTVIKTIGVLCVGLAHKNNKVTQKKFAEEGAIGTLVELLVTRPSEETQVEVAYTLGCLVNGNQENEEKLNEESGFKFNILLDLLHNTDRNIRLKAGFALAIFAFNNTPRQYAIRQAGGIKIESLEEFLNDGDEFSSCNAAFQMVILARVITDLDQVSLTARGVTKLVEILKSTNDNSVILAASLMSSMAHTRAGIPDAMIIVGAIELLIQRLFSDNDQVRFACAVALGYLTFNRTATRRLLVACRNTPGLFDRLMDNIGKKPRISPEFTEEFKCQRIIGLPCLSLERHGGPPVIPHTRGPRPATTHGRVQKTSPRSAKVNRAYSAPAVIQRTRAKSASSLKLRSFHSEIVPPSTGDSSQAGIVKTKLSAWDNQNLS